MVVGLGPDCRRVLNGIVAGSPFRRPCVDRTPRYFHRRRTRFTSGCRRTPPAPVYPGVTYLDAEVVSARCSQHCSCSPVAVADRHGDRSAVHRCPVSHFRHAGPVADPDIRDADPTLGAVTSASSLGSLRRGPKLSALVVPVVTGVKSARTKVSARGRLGHRRPTDLRHR